MALSWTNITSPDSWANIRSAINTWITAATGDINSNTTDIQTNAAAIGTLQSNVSTLQTESADYDARLTTIEGLHTVNLAAQSVASSQAPTATDTPLQIEFGPAQYGATDPVQIDAAGTITFNETGNYFVHLSAHFGRTGGVGTSILLFRLLLNGTQLGHSLSAKLANADVYAPWSDTFEVTVNAGDTLKAYVMRDSAGDNSGGLYSLTPTDVTWNSVATASIQVYKV